MIRKILLTVIVSAAAFPVFSQENSALQARKKYDAGDYVGAASLFQEALNKAPKNPTLEYDLGNALFKSGKLGLSIAAYQRAFDIQPRNGDIRYNLSFALRRAGENFVPAGIPPILFTLCHW